MTVQRHTSRQWGQILVLLAIGCGFVSSFHISMVSEYKPAVKSSVGKLSSRFGGSGHGRRAARSSKTTAKSAYAGTMMPQELSFEQRMRDLVVGDPTRRTEKKALPQNVQTIRSLKEYKRVVADEAEKVVAVRFFASYCKACQAVAPHFYKLAKQFPGTVFVDVPVTAENAALHQGLGIPTLPFAHIYTPSGLVEEQKLTRKDISEFKTKLEAYVNA